ncbi:hypothetical protein ABZ766_32505 [Streptomyces sp. NPDC006670]|uniref:hypothetical protein n=1 Tax=Streptomyces sp. NPDC006670 TaxID=3154476 RepID=UPI0033F17B62
MIPAEDMRVPDDRVLLQLPGSRRHMAGLGWDLRDGFTCLWIFPAALVEKSAADRFVEDLRSTLENVVEVPAPSRGGAVVGPSATAAPWRAVGGWFDEEPGDGFLDDYDDGLGAPPWAAAGHARSLPIASPARLDPSTVEERLAKELGVVGDPIEHLTGPEASGDAPIILVRTWNEDDGVGLARMMRRLTAAVKGGGLAPGRRPRLLVAARLEDLPVDTPDSLDAAVAKVHWWWSVWGRLDTATVVAGTDPSPGSRGSAVKRILGAVRSETVSEVSGPHMEVALGLSRAWDGTLGSLRECLVSLASRAGAEADGQVRPAVAAPAASAYGPVPAQPLRSRWSAGLLDSWEGQLRPAVQEWIGGPGAQTQLDKLVWQSQNRVLLPLIDDARAGFTGLLPRFASQGLPRLHALYRDRYATVADLESMELGDIWSGVKQGHIRLSGTQYRRLKALRHARNELAHRRPLDDRALSETVRALTQPVDDDAGPVRRLPT